jgi:Tfp pilus assembly protein PilF
MVRRWSAIGIASLVLLNQGCATEPGRAIQAQVQSLFGPSKGQPALQAGLRQYENGDYLDAQKSLQKALADGLADGERVVAHKHVAFIHCASGRERPCREEFRKALAIEPDLELAPAEAGHPLWGPVFRSLKAGR